MPVRALMHDWRTALPFADEGRDVIVTGVVSSLPVKLERGVRFEFDVESHEDRRRRAAAPAARLVCGGRTGAARRALALRSAPATAARSDESRRVRLRSVDARAQPARQRLRAHAGHAAAERLQSMVWSPGVAIERARAWLRDRLVPHLQAERYGGVVLALVLGDQRAIADADWTLFNRTGITHLVSISGLHITMIAALAGGIAGARLAPHALAAAARAGPDGGHRRRGRRCAPVCTARGLGHTGTTDGPDARLCRRGVDGTCARDTGCGAGTRGRSGVRVRSLGRDGRRVLALVRCRRSHHLGRAGTSTPRRFVGAERCRYRSARSDRRDAGAGAGDGRAVPADVAGGAAGQRDRDPADQLDRDPARAGRRRHRRAARSCSGRLPRSSSGSPARSSQAWLRCWPLCPRRAGPLWPCPHLPGGSPRSHSPGSPGCWRRRAGRVRALGAVALVPLFVWPVERPLAGGLWVTALDVGQGSAVVLETREHALAVRHRAALLAGLRCRGARDPALPARPRHPVARWCRRVASRPGSLRRCCLGAARHRRAPAGEFGRAGACGAGRCRRRTLRCRPDDGVRRHEPAGAASAGRRLRTATPDECDELRRARAGGQRGGPADRRPSGPRRGGADPARAGTAGELDDGATSRQPLVVERGCCSSRSLRRSPSRRQAIAIASGTPIRGWPRATPPAASS